MGGARQATFSAGIPPPARTWTNAKATSSAAISWSRGPGSPSPFCDSSRAVPAGKLTKPQVTQLDGNVYVRNEAAGPAALLFWSPLEADNGMAEFKTLEEFQRLHPQFEAHSKVVTSSLGALFKSPDLSRYELIQDISLPASATPLPDEVRQLLGWQKQEAIVPGAYTSRP